MGVDSVPPDDRCTACAAWRGWHGLRAWSRILIPIAITLIVATGGAAATSLVRDADTRSTVDALEERRIEASDERQRLAAEQRASEREYAHHRQEESARWEQIAAALARIEARLDNLERRPRRRMP